MRFDPARWERVQTLFHAALELPQPARAGFLEKACAGDDALRLAVAGLLEADARGAPVLDRGLAEAAGEILDQVPVPYSTIGPYEISGVLGRGGMGVVYLGERRDVGGKAAIKILRDADFSPARRARFAMEQRTLASLDHPSIARLFDADVLSDGTPYFIMEYVDGVPLTEHCTGQGQPLRARLEIFREVCEAVQAAHRQAIVHRDLKPSNILVKADGSLKLLDFGIAKQLDPTDTAADPTQTLVRMMTPAYAAPEQVQGKPVGIYTDIYSLGVILYELLTGRQPFDLSEVTPGEAEALITRRDPERPSWVAPGGEPGSRPLASRGQWADLDVMCLTAMHKDPQRRYRTVQGLIRDIDNFLRGDPLDAQPDSLGYRTRKFLGRNARPVAAGGIVAVLGIVLVTFYTLQLSAARDAALAETARAQRIQGFMLDLFQGGDEAAGPADTLRVLTVLDRGVREAGALDSEPTVQAELLQTLGGLYQQLGGLDLADSLLSRALESRRSLASEDGAELSRSLIALGSLRVSQARLAEAEQLVREGLDLARSRNPPGHPAVLDAETALGRVLQETGAYDQAISVLEEVAGRRARSDPEGPELAEVLGELANTHFYAGNYEAADSLNRLIVEMDRRRFGPAHPNVADGIINLGAVQFQWGRYEEAERLYREALVIMEGYFGPEHPETASNLTLLGRSLNYQGRSEEAVGYLRRALDIQMPAFGAMHPTVASTRNEIGLIALATGDLGTAEESFVKMAEIYDSVYADPHWLKGIARSNLAAVHLEAGRYPEAERFFRDAANLFSQTLSPEDMNTGIARIKLGRALVRQERWAEAEAESRAGYGILMEKTDPGISWLQSARADLAAAYDALGRPEEARAFRTEAEGYAKAPSG